MCKTIQVFTFTILLFVGNRGPLLAAEGAVAGDVGPQIMFNQDFNNQNTKSALGFAASFDIFYQLPCKGCFNWALLLTGGYNFSGDFDFGTTVRRQTGHIGRFKESFEVGHVVAGVDWSAPIARRLRTHLSLGPGIYFLKRKGVSYVDANDSTIPTPPLSNQMTRFGIMLSMGLEVVLSERVGVGIAPRYHMVFPGLPKGSFLQIPFFVKFYF